MVPAPRELRRLSRVGILNLGVETEPQTGIDTVMVRQDQGYRLAWPGVDAAGVCGRALLRRSPDKRLLDERLRWS